MRQMICKMSRKRAVRCFKFWSLTMGKFWTIALVLLLLNFGLLTYNVHFTQTKFDGKRKILEIDRQKAEHTGYMMKNKSTEDTNISIDSGYKFAQTVHDKCKQFGSKFEIHNTFWITRMHLLSKQKSIYCPVEKVGTTFWRRFIYQLNHTNEFINPYEVSIRQALLQRFESLSNTTKPSDVRDYFKFTFVRDPYNRILSAYIDKLFSPNPLFWKRFGQPAISLFRDSNSLPGRHRGRRICNSDPTFKEFLQFVTWTGRTQQKIDPHILMISEMCVICSMSYTFIGKMENFNDDSTEIFRKFGLDQEIRSSNQSLSSLAAKDAIEDSISSPFSWKRSITSCMGWYEALLRIWRKLQMRGLIEMKYKLPFERKVVNQISKKDFLKLAYIAHGSSNHSVLKIQKRQVIIEMYRTIPEKIINEFRDVYKMDFKLFDYDDKPAYIFDKSIPFVRRNFTNFRN